VGLNRILWTLITLASTSFILALIIRSLIWTCG
jgi:hypothetical protein